MHLSLPWKKMRFGDVCIVCTDNKGTCDTLMFSRLIDDQSEATCGMLLFPKWPIKEEGYSVAYVCQPAHLRLRMNASAVIRRFIEKKMKKKKVSFRD